MSKPLLGIVLGAILGAIDGLTAWFTPAVRNQLGGIVIGSTIKGIIAGVVGLIQCALGGFLNLGQILQSYLFA